MLCRQDCRLGGQEFAAIAEGRQEKNAQCDRTFHTQRKRRRK